MKRPSGWRRRAVLRRIASTLALLASLTGLAPGVARGDSYERLIVEVGAGASRSIDPRAAERLLALETADVDVPSPPDVSPRPPLYFRILTPTQAALRVELWELGRPYGARSVSTAGTSNLRTRRIALAAAELARQLRHRRLAELAAARRAPRDGQRPASTAEGSPIYARFRWSAGVRGGSVGSADAWLVGPALGATLRFTSGQRVSVGAAWLVGKAPLFGSGARWFDVTLALAQGVALTQRFSLDVGLAASAASIRLAEPGGAGSAPVDTWSSLGFAFVRAEAQLSRPLSLSVGPDLGVVLRPISATGPDGGTHRLGGPWIGGTLALSVQP